MKPDYYGHQALVRLDRPVALIGWVGSYTRAVGLRIAAALGLPFADLDRLVAHEAGESVGTLVARDGERRFRELESVLLHRALRDTPKGILSLGDGALLEDGNRQAVAESSLLAVLDLDLPNLFWRIQRLTGEGGGESWHPFIFEPPERLEDLRSFYEARRPGFARAEYRLDVRALGPTEAALRLMEAVPVLRPVGGGR